VAAWADIPPDRIREPHHVAGIGPESDAQDRPVARDQGRKPAAYHWTARGMAICHGMRNLFGVAQVMPE